MEQQYKTVIELSKEPGVKDLPLAAWSAFAHALDEEAKGNDQLAASYLDKAIEAEAKWREQNAPPAKR